ncbi:MAG: hemerythrin domain-containing protein [Thermoanaerobaculia bacterium]|nr:hemerythrin domain-containing protein [Thermoanaerobaculia bacterium]
MKITDALYGEHGPLYALLTHCESSAAQWELADLMLAGRAVEAALLSHAAVEDDLLFGALAARMPAGGPVEVMRAEHEAIDADLAALRVAEDEGPARRAMLRVVQQAREHFAKEEQVLFPLAEELVGAAELERLGAEWAARRGVACGARSPCHAGGGFGCMAS